MTDDYQPKLVALACLFSVFTQNGRYADATVQWNVLSALLYGDDIAPQIVAILSSAGRVANRKFLLETISKSPWAEPLAPFLRALEYVESGDRELIEKLSPEVRLVVEDLVARIQRK
ncbi:hypothetical protein SBA3_200022 [Candidatus Sulfopaludibacter sp. SbA3]|nr:hypothetical protein SBA3_200022 [Candidatus Sulfopaludibacter sp. SbA3]